MENNIILKMALDYAEAGFRVIPLDGKKPITTHGVKDGTTDTTQITEWFTANPNANIGIVAGEFNGKQLIVVDLDIGHADGIDGTKTLTEWEAQNGKLPETLTAKTGSGGYHLYFYSDKVYKNGANILKGFEGAEQTGIDTRCEGGYLVAPPSVHPVTGERYEWIGGFDVNRIAGGGNALDKLLSYRDQAQNKQTQKNKVWKSAGEVSADWQGRPTEGETREAGLDSINDLKLDFKQGSRNDDLYRLACSLQAKGISDNEIRAFVLNVNDCLCKPALEKAEVEKTIESALKQPKGSNKEKKKRLPHFSYEGFSGYIENLVPPTFFQFNEVSRDIETFGRDENDFIDNVITVKLVTELEHYFVGVTKNAVEDYISLYAYEHRCNPVLAQIDGTEWDGVDRLEHIYKMLGISDDELSCVFVRKWLMEAYCGLFNTKKEAFALDLVLVFQGKQGFGKTRLLEKLALGYFGEGESLNPTDKDSIMAVASSFLFELGELGSTMRRDKDVTKTFISRPKDRLRLPYGRNLITMARRTVMAGTVNEQEFLVDDTGNRRWATVPLSDDVSIDMEELKKFDAVQLWAQIKAIVNEEIAKGKTRANCWRLTTEEAAQRDKRNLAFAKPIYGEQEVLDVLAHYTDEKAAKNVNIVEQWRTATEFLAANDEALRGLNAAAICKVFRKLGIEAKFDSHNKTTKWKLPWRQTW